MKLRVKDIGLESGGALVAVLNKQDAVKYDLHAADRILISHNKKNVNAIIDVSDTNKTVKPGQLGLFEEILKELNCKGNDLVSVKLSNPIDSVNYIKKKLQGKKLTKKEFIKIVGDVINNNLSEVELTYFVSACYTYGLNLDEIIYLTKAIIQNGESLRLNKKLILDKHSIGGVPGNRTSMIIVPIIASLGYTIPKTSSRAISSATGTSDTMEVLASVSFPVTKIKSIIRKTNGCMVWGGGFNLASADDHLIRVRYPLSLDPRGMMIASIMAKKAAVKTTHLVIDFPIGNEAKIKSMKEALNLKKEFYAVGKRLGIKVKVIITDGSQPVGNGIGPALEARDVLNVLKNNGPNDLRDKAVKLATALLEMINVKDAKKKIMYSLESGLAYKKLMEIIKEQNGNPNIKINDIKLGTYTKSIKAWKSGKVNYLSNKIFAKLARIAGSPNDKGAGVYLNVRVNTYVKKDDALFTIYSESNSKLDYALDFLKENNPIIIR